MEKTVDMKGGGRLTLRQEGIRVFLSAKRPGDGKGLYKVRLHGGQGGGLLLGTMAPEDGELRLKRTLSVDELERAGCWPDFWVECVLAFPFVERGESGWYCERQPERFFSDALLKGWAKGSMLCRRGVKGFSLAASFRTDRPMAMAGLFCLGRVEKWSKGYYVVWKFDHSGRPLTEKDTDCADEKTPGAKTGL